MKNKTWRPRTRKHEIRSFRFGGTGIGLNGVSFRDFPVGVEFIEDVPENAERVVFQMTIEEAERVHRALGDMIELRKRQAERQAAVPPVGNGL